jgi:hypothetical protein
MGLERVVKLIRSHRVRVARALVRQTRALVPRYEALDPLAQERTFYSLLLGVERLLEHGDEEPMLDVASHIAQLRVTMGFRVEDFTAASLSFLPVVRRFIMEHAEDFNQGIADYEQFEAIALPFLARSGNIFSDAAEEPTQPSLRHQLHNQLQNQLQNQTQKQTQRNLGGMGPMVPVRIERVLGDDAEEGTLQNFPAPFSIRSAD